jgi:hypothetical protein
MTDRGEPGNGDQISVVLVDGTADPTVLSNIIYSSHWMNFQTRQLYLRGGNLVVHSGFSITIDGSDPTDTPIAARAAEFGVKAYPNPFSDHVYFDLQLKTDSKVRLELFDISGSKIATIYDDIVVAFDRYRFEYTPENVSSGTLFYRLIIDGKLEFTGTLIHQ